MPNYDNGCIYMLRHKDDVELQNIYIGSTTNFRGRKWQHKSSCTCENDRRYNQKKYQYIRANGGWDNWIMVWMEDYPCKSKRELEKKEDEVMLQYQNRINEKRCVWTNESRKKGYDRYNYENREKRNEFEKERYKNNKEQINNYRKEKIKCDICGCESTRHHIARHQRTIKCQSHKMST